MIAKDFLLKQLLPLTTKLLTPTSTVTVAPTETTTVSNTSTEASIVSSEQTETSNTPDIDGILSSLACGDTDALSDAGIGYNKTDNDDGGYTVTFTYDGTDYSVTYTPEKSYDEEVQDFIDSLEGSEFDSYDEFVECCGDYYVDISMSISSEDDEYYYYNVSNSQTDGASAAVTVKKESEETTSTPTVSSEDNEETTTTPASSTEEDNESNEPSGATTRGGSGSEDPAPALNSEDNIESNEPSGATTRGGADSDGPEPARDIEDGENGSGPKSRNFDEPKLVDDRIGGGGGSGPKSRNFDEPELVDDRIGGGGGSNPASGTGSNSGTDNIEPPAPASNSEDNIESNEPSGATTRGGADSDGPESARDIEDGENGSGPKSRNFDEPELVDDRIGGGGGSNPASGTGSSGTPATGGTEPSGTGDTNSTSGTDNVGGADWDEQVQDFIDNSLDGQSFDSEEEFQEFCGDYYVDLYIETSSEDDEYVYYNVSNSQTEGASAAVTVKKAAAETQDISEPSTDNNTELNETNKARVNGGGASIVEQLNEFLKAHSGESMTSSDLAELQSIVGNDKNYDLKTGTSTHYGKEVTWVSLEFIENDEGDTEDKGYWHIFDSEEDKQDFENRKSNSIEVEEYINALNLHEHFPEATRADMLKYRNMIKEAAYAHLDDSEAAKSTALDMFNTIVKGANYDILNDIQNLQQVSDEKLADELRLFLAKYEDIVNIIVEFTEDKKYDIKIEVPAVEEGEKSINYEAIINKTDDVATVITAFCNQNPDVKLEVRSKDKSVFEASLAEGDNANELREKYISNGIPAGVVELFTKDELEEFINAVENTIPQIQEAYDNALKESINNYFADELEELAKENGSIPGRRAYYTFENDNVDFSKRLYFAKIGVPIEILPYYSDEELDKIVSELVPTLDVNLDGITAIKNTMLYTKVFSAEAKFSKEDLENQGFGSFLGFFEKMYFDYDEETDTYKVKTGIVNGYSIEDVKDLIDTLGVSNLDKYLEYLAERDRFSISILPDGSQRRNYGTDEHNTLYGLFGYLLTTQQQAGGGSLSDLYDQYYDPDLDSKKEGTTSVPLRALRNAMDAYLNNWVGKENVPNLSFKEIVYHILGEIDDTIEKCGGKINATLGVENYTIETNYARESLMKDLKFFNLQNVLYHDSASALQEFGIGSSYEFKNLVEGDGNELEKFLSAVIYNLEDNESEGITYNNVLWDAILSAAKITDDDNIEARVAKMQKFIGTNENEEFKKAMDEANTYNEQWLVLVEYLMLGEKLDGEKAFLETNNTYSLAEVATLFNLEWAAENMEEVLDSNGVGTGQYRIKAGKEIIAECGGPTSVNERNLALQKPNYMTEAEARMKGYTVVTNATELLDALNRHHYSTIVLCADIDMSEIENWIPVGTDADPFTGKICGNGHTIKNLNVKSNNQYSGLFGVFAGEIHDLTLENCKVTDTRSDSVKGMGGTGILAGKFSGTCSNINIINGEVEGRDNAGLLFGIIEPEDDYDTNTTTPKTISNCSVSGSVKGGYAAGGIAGKYTGNTEDNKYQISIIGCKSSADVDGNVWAGGIVGQADHVFAYDISGWDDFLKTSYTNAIECLIKGCEYNGTSTEKVTEHGRTYEKQVNHYINKNVKNPPGALGAGAIAGQITIDEKAYDAAGESDIFASAFNYGVKDSVYIYNTYAGGLNYGWICELNDDGSVKKTQKYFRDVADNSIGKYTKQADNAFSAYGTEQWFNEHVKDSPAAMPYLKYLAAALEEADSVQEQFIVEPSYLDVIKKVILVNYVDNFDVNNPNGSLKLDQASADSYVTRANYQEYSEQYGEYSNDELTQKALEKLCSECIKMEYDNWLITLPKAMGGLALNHGGFRNQKPDAFVNTSEPASYTFSVGDDTYRVSFKGSDQLYGSEEYPWVDPEYITNDELRSKLKATGISDDDVDRYISLFFKDAVSKTDKKGNKEVMLYYFSSDLANKLHNGYSCQIKNIDDLIKYIKNEDDAYTHYWNRLALEDDTFYNKLAYKNDGTTANYDWYNKVSGIYSWGEEVHSDPNSAWYHIVYYLRVWDNKNNKMIETSIPYNSIFNDDGTLNLNVLKQYTTDQRLISMIISYFNRQLPTV